MRHHITDNPMILLNVLIGGLGLLASWVAFTKYALEFGPDLVGFWSTALTSTGHSGLTYDLVACGAMLDMNRQTQRIHSDLVAWRLLARIAGSR